MGRPPKTNVVVSDFATDPKRILGLTEEQYELFMLQALEKRLAELQAVTDVTTYGLPDLNFPRNPEEPEDQYILRQNMAMKDFIENKMWFVKDAKVRRIVLNKEMMFAIADILFKRVTKAIWWKPRGGGGSLGAAVLIFLLMIYRKISILNMSGCLTPGSLVWTERLGWAPVEQTNVGDRVYTSAGKVAVVRAVTSKNWSRTITKIVPYGYGPGHTFTSDHKLSVLKDVVTFKYGKLGQQEPSSWDKREPEWAPVGGLTDKDALVIPRPKYEKRELPTLRIPISRNGRGQTRELKWSQELCEFIGYWLAEGSIAKANGSRFVQIDLSKEDHWLGRYLDLVRDLFDRTPSYDEPGGDATLEARIRFGSNAVSDFLVSLFGSGAERKTIPWDLIIGLPDNCLRALLIGYLRGDGGAKGTNRGSHDVSSYTCSPKLAAALYWISIRLGLYPSIGREYPDAKRSGFKKVRPGWTLRFGSVDSDALLEQVSLDKPKKRVHRQRHIWVTRDRIYVGIRSLETKPYEGLVWDLTIDGDPSFAMPGMLAHNSGEQAKNVYEYVKQFWNCFPSMKEALLDGEPLLSKTALVNGATLTCISNSEKASRGKHPPALVCDEACQRDRGSDAGFEAAIQTVMSEPDPVVLMLSTFHHPVGMFQEYWDHAEEKGFVRYKWNVFQTMSKCTIPDISKGYLEGKVNELGHAIPNDCMSCTLTRVDHETDAFGKPVSRIRGCAGQAVHSDGYQNFEAVVRARDTNKGTSTFHTEFEGIRPDVKIRVVDDEAVDSAKVNGDTIEWTPDCDIAVGIDWGLAGQTAIILGVERPTDVAIIEAEFMTGKLTGEVIKLLNDWEEAYGRRLRIYADGSHPYNNLELITAGFKVEPVHFKKWKKFAYGNLLSYLVNKKLLIADDLAVLLGQLRELKRDKYGNIVKKNDHGPDATVCMLLAFPFMEKFPELLLVGFDGEAEDTEEDDGVRVF